MRSLRVFFPRAFVVAVLLTSATAREIPEFKPPSPEACRAALGDISGLSDAWKRALDEKNFEPLPLPDPDDWLAKRQEFAQPLAAYAISRRPKIRRDQRTIYLLPIGEDVTGLAPFLQAYYRLPVKVLPAEPAPLRPVVAAESALAWLRPKVPEDAFALIAITSADLHPGHRVPANRGTRFLFGRARFSGHNAAPRVGIVSTARLEGDPLRLRKLLTHETGHLFGLAHCVYYRCAMNGSAHLAEADARPVHLCPVCLRKLSTAVRFDPEKRARAIMQTFETAAQ